MVDDLPAEFFQKLATPTSAQNPYGAFETFHQSRRPRRLRSGEYVVADYDNVKDALADPEFLKPVPLRTPFSSIQTIYKMFFMLNGGDHLRLRQAVLPLFTPRTTETRAAQIAQAAGALLDERSSLDVIRDLAYPLPFGLVCDWLGAPPGERPAVAEWASAMTDALDRPSPVLRSAIPRFIKSVLLDPRSAVRTVRAANGAVRYAKARLTSDEVEPGADFLVAFRRCVDNGSMSLDEAAASWILMLTAGHETTANLIGNTAYELLTHPEQLEAVRRDPALMPAALDETLRHESPVTTTVRVANRDRTLGGVRIPTGAPLFLVLGAANRDPAHYHQPDRFDITRDARDHLAFGHGLHFCLGAQLAKAEARVAILALIARAPRLTDEPPRWRATFATRGLDSMSVQLEPANHDAHSGSTR